MGARAIAAVIAAAALVVASPAASLAVAEVEKSTYRVPVTQPDEAGAAVELEVDTYLPEGDPPSGGRPFVVFFHGGGSNKDSGFDADHARHFAEHGYVTLLYSARGHGDSDGQTSVAGPKEMRDTFDVIAWALGIGGRDAPPHPDFHIDTSRIGLSGYSQGGLNTNLAQAWSSDPVLNPYGVRFRALTPGNTPDVVFTALVPNQVVKLSFGIGLLGTYFGGAQGRVAPAVDRWIATAAVDQPALYGGELCDHTGHGTPTSTMRQDLAARSAGCLLERMTPPSHWAQAFDDTLFTADMAIRMWRQMPAGAANRLYLSMGGHGAPSALRSIEEAKLGEQLAFMDHHLRGRPLGGRRVVYWTRDPAVRATEGSFAYRDGAWIGPIGAPSWPPPGDRGARLSPGCRRTGRGHRRAGWTHAARSLQPRRGQRPRRPEPRGRHAARILTAAVASHPQRARPGGELRHRAIRRGAGAERRRRWRDCRGRRRARRASWCSSCSTPRPTAPSPCSPGECRACATARPVSSGP